MNEGQTIYELLTVPAHLTEYVSSHLTANYPEVLIKKLEHDPLHNFHQSLPKAFGELILSSPSYLPFRTYQQFGETDSIASLLSSFAKLGENEMALIQYVFRKVRDTSKKSGRSLIANGV